GGIMVFARNSKAAKRLSNQIQNKEFKKSYLAVIPGFNKQKDELTNYIDTDSNGNRFITTKDKGKYAELKYELIKKIDNLSLVKIDLITGRHHQIRIQFKNIGYPLYGDQRYGIKDNKQLALFAYR